MKEFNINYMFSSDRSDEYYYNENEFTKYVVSLLSKLFDDNQFEFSFVDFYDMGVEFSGTPSSNNFLIESLKFNFILSDSSCDMDDLDGEELLEFFESNSDYELFSIPKHLQFNLINFKNFDSSPFFGGFPKVGFQIFNNKSKGKGYKSLCLRPHLPFYFEQ